MKKNNILLHDIQTDGSTKKINEVVPTGSNSRPDALLGRIDSSYCWFVPNDIEASTNISLEKKGNTIYISASFPETKYSIFDGNNLKDTSVYYRDGRLGLNRIPLHSYLFDIGIERGRTTTAFHIGDGTRGFSMGNGAKDGFVPQIIGMGADEYDTGLYLLGRSGNDASSHVPLITMDARNVYDERVTNRPLFGITSSDYNSHHFLVKPNGDVKITGVLEAKDVNVKGFKLTELLVLIKEQHERINILEKRLKDK